MNHTKTMKKKGMKTTDTPVRIVEIQFKAVSHPTAVHKVSRAKRLFTEFSGNPSLEIAQNRFAWRVTDESTEAVMKAIAVKYGAYVSRGEVYISHKENRRTIAVL